MYIAKYDKYSAILNYDKYLLVANKGKYFVPYKVCIINENICASFQLR